MSPLPGQTLTFRDPGLGLVELSGNTFFLLGTSEKGTLNVVQSLSSPAAVVDALGEGPLSELAASLLDIAGGPVYACRVAGTVAGTTGAVTKTAQSTSTGTVAAAGAAYRRYDVVLEITKTGTVGVGEFRYSLDNGRSFTDVLTLPSGGTYVVPRTNVTLTFTPGAGALFFEKGDRFTFTTTAPHYSATELAAAIDALRTYLAQTPGFVLDAIVLAGLNQTGAASATLFGALSVQLLSLESIYRYVGAIMDGGSGDTRANVKTALSAVSDARIMVVYGECEMASSKPFSGHATPRVPLLNAIAARCARLLPSTDPARFADGPLPGVLSVTHDEFVTEDLDAAKIATARTFPGTPGFFVANARLKSPIGSDFLYWQHRRVMDLAARLTVAAQQVFVNAEFRTTQTGALEETEALRVEQTVKPQLDQALMQPKNASGRRGYVSEFGYTVDRLVNVLSTQTARTSVSVRPLFYAKRLTTEIGFALHVGA
jgi:hypothetical protein